MSLPRRITAAAAATLALTSAGIAAAPSASAATRETICADNLYVRDAPRGHMIGTLYRGETFDVERYSPSGAYAYGMAYGDVKRHGWVQRGWFC
jgi:hypothetical protein